MDVLSAYMSAAANRLLPAEAAEHAKHHLLDTLASMISGSELAPGQAAQRGSAVYFRVPDIHGVHSTLVERGVRFVAPPHVVHRTPAAEFWLAEFTDPFGNQLALMSEVALAAS